MVKNGMTVLFVLVMLSCVFSSFAHAQMPQIQPGLDYLTLSQNHDGTWDNGTSSTETTAATVSVIETLKLLNLTASNPYTAGVSWLQVQSPTSVGYIAERSLALHLADSGAGGLIAALDAVKGAWGGAMGYDTDVLDTALALKALKNTNSVDSTIIDQALAYLATSQNSDGGWGFRFGGPSDICVTSIVSATLQQFPQMTTIAAAVGKARAFLLAKQNPDGGFGDSAAFETALAYIALVADPLCPSLSLQNAVSFLFSTQSANGSWNDDPYSTALALKALYYYENKPAPPPPPPAGGRITGTVIDAVTKAPVSGVSIVLGSNSLVNTTSDSFGNFTLSDIPAGSQAVSFTLSGYAAKTASIILVVGSVADLGKLALVSSYSTGAIAGIINDSTGKPVPNAAITVTGSWSGSTVTGADGSYSFSYVTPGEVTIAAARSGFVSANGVGTVYARTTLYFSPRLNNTPPQAATGALVGRVIGSSFWEGPILPIDGEPGVRITLSDGTYTEPDQNGYFVMQGIAPNTYQTTVGKDGFATKSLRVVITPGTTTDVGTIRLESTVSEMTLTGKVTDVFSGAPIPGAELITSDGNLTGRTDFAGVYAIADIKHPSVFTIRVTAPGYVGKSFVVGSSAWLERMDFNLVPQITKGSLTGVVADASTGMPIPGATITLLSAPDHNAKSDSSGAFSFSAVPEGVQRFTVASAGYETRTVTTPIIAGTGNNLGKIPLSVNQLGASIQGSVWDAVANKAFSGASLQTSGAAVLQTTSADDGGYRIDNVVPGAVSVEATAPTNPGYYPVRFTGILEPGGLLVFNPSLTTLRPTAVDLTVQTDKGSYRKGDSVGISVVLRNRESVTRSASLRVKINDPTGATIFEDVAQAEIPGEGVTAQDFSAPLPANVQGGEYTICAELFDNTGANLGSVRATFGVATSRITITPTLPAAFQVGANEITFDLANTGELPVATGVLEVTLKAPDESVVGTAVQPFALGLGQSATLKLSLTVPSLQFGNYTLSYIQRDETKGGEKTVVSLPNSIAVTALYDDASHRIRNTAGLTIGITNTGKFNFDPAATVAVNVSVPDAAYSATKALPSLPAAGSASVAAVLFNHLIPDTLAAGHHETKVTVTLPSGSSFTQTTALSIAESSLALSSIQGAYAAGGAIYPVFSNQGGVDTQAAYRFRLVDDSSTVIAEKVATESVVAGSDRSVEINIPAGAVNGTYLLVATYNDTETGKEGTLQNFVSINGVKGTLHAQTDKQNYLLTENITGLSTVTNTGTELPSGNAHLQVVTGSGSYKRKTWTTQADFQAGVVNGVDTYGVNDWIIPDDDFEGSALDSAKWSKIGNASVVGGKLFVDSSTTNSSVYSTYKLDGDFDIEVDFSENVSSNNGVSFAVNGGSYYLAVSNTIANGYSCNVVLNGVQKSFNRLDAYSPSGRLRIARVSDTITGYYWNGSAWVEITRGQSSEFLTPVSVIMEIWSIGPNSAKYDNFKVNSGRIKMQNQTVDSVRLLPLSDNFDSSMLNKDRWRIDTPGCTPLSNGSPACNAWLNNGKLEMKTIANTSDIQFITASHRDNWIQGDFDVQVDYTNLNLTQSGWMYSFKVYFSEGPGIKTAYHWYDHRWSGKSYNAVYRNASNTVDETASSVGTTDDSGRLRLKRVGDLLYWYYWNKLANRWEWNGNPAGFSMRVPLTPVKVSMSTVKIPYANTTPDVLWDNLVVSPQKYPYSGRINLKHDSGKTSIWKAIQYKADFPEGTSIKFRARTAETETGLTTATWSDYFAGSGSFLNSLPGRWIEIETTLFSQNAQVTPTLHDISVTYETDPEQILWQTDVPVNLAASAQAEFNKSIGSFGVVGKLYLQGTLTSSTGQIVATSEYPFYVEQGDFQLVLTPDKKVYRPGETVTINGESRNFVSVAATGLTLKIKDAAGTILHTETFDVPANGSHPFSFTAIAGADGTYSLKGSLIQNGATVADVTYQYEVGSPNVAATMAVPDSVGSEQFQAALTLTNSGKTEAVVTIAKSFDPTVETMIIPAGEKRFLQYGQQITADTTYTFTITGDLSMTLAKTVEYNAPPLASTVTGKVAVDKAFFNPNEHATLISTLTATSFMENLSLLIIVTNNQGQAVYTESTAIAQIHQGQTTTIKKYWNVGTNPAATYLVTLQALNSAGAVIAKSTCDLVIATATAPTALLKGQVTLNKQSILTGEPVGVVFNVTNTGNIDLATVGLSIQTVNVSDQTVYNTIYDQASLSIGATHSGNGTIDTRSYSARDYLVVFRATIDGVEETLGGTYFRVEGAPSAPALVAPAAGADEESLTPALTVSNAADPNEDRLAYQFEVYTDSSLTSLAASGEVPGTAGMTIWATTVPLVENQTYYWRARAYDGHLYGAWMNTASFRVNTVNDPPSAPTVSGPVNGTEVAMLAPQLTVSNANDPDSASLTYNFDVALDPDFMEMVASASGVSPGSANTSWTVPVNLQENGIYYWRAQADDWLIAGPWSVPARFFVNTSNEPPSVPAISAPAAGSTVASLATEVAVANSSDADSPLISYFFEADTVPTFDSPKVIRSAGIAEGSGFTSWALTGLEDNTRYYLRVKASDGSADSAWSATTSFFANTANDAPSAPVLANPSSGAGVKVFAPVLSVYNASDLDLDRLNYVFELYSDQAMTDLVAREEGIPEGAQVTDWQVPVLLTENRTYYWRSRAFDGALHGEWTAAASFTVNTANDAPGAPKVSSPADGAGVEVLNPSLAVVNAADPDSDNLSYQFEVYAGGSLVGAGSSLPEDVSGITSWTPEHPLADDTVYRWRARAYDGDSYGPWTDMATFTVHVPRTSITATIDFDPDTLNRGSNGTWVVVYIELPQGYRPADIDLASVRLDGVVPAEVKPFAIGDHDKDGIADLMVKFRRSEVINRLSAGDKVTVEVSGTVGPMNFDGVDVIRVIK